MASSSTRLLTACAIAGLLPFVATADDGGSRWIDVEFSRDSPVLPVSFSLGPGSTAGVRGTSMAFELHASLLLRNTGTKPLSGLTLRVEAKDLTPSGKGSVSIPSLQIAPGEVFPVRIDMELLRPFTVMKSDGAVFQLSLDCALFADMTSYGPDKLGSKRALMVYELEARRDRQYLAELLRSGRIPQLREELNFGLQDVTPQQLGLELLRDPLSDTRREQALNVQAVSFASAPVQPLGGAARVVGNQVRSPQIEVRNTSQKAVRSIAMGWIVRDERGRDFLAGSVPAPIQLAPVQTGTMTESGTLRFSHPLGQPMSIEGLTAFINDVEFADGKLWIPSRADIQAATPDPVLRRALVTSPEQQRLAEIYRRKGVAGLAEALRATN